MPVVRAAGGLLWRAGRPGDGNKGGARVRLAVIHRPHRKDWSLPKGKLDDGETWEACALREVREETGCEGRLAAFAGAMSYVPRNNPKIVLYWHMELTREGKLEAKFRDEIDEVAWLTPDEALARLDYAGERRIVQRFPEGLSPPAPPLAPGAGERDAALCADLATFRADLLRRITVLGRDDHGSGLVPALDLVAAAEDAAAAGRAEEARLLLAAGRRMALLSMQEPERSLRARLLLEEASKLPPFSRRAIRKLLVGERVSPEAIYLAAEVRDEALATTPARETAETAESPENGEAEEKRETSEIEENGETSETDENGETSETEVNGETPETDEPRETPSDAGEASSTALLTRTALPPRALAVVAGLAVLGLGVLLLLAGAGGASVAGTVVTSALVGGAAGLFASRRR
jgi:8-oxo-dGTP diphosphatase